MDSHLTFNYIAAFSFLSTAFFMCFVKMSPTPFWYRLRRCRWLLVLTFLVVGISCTKNILIRVPFTMELIRCTTLISASLQSLILGCTVVTFVAPERIGKRFLLYNIAIILVNSVQIVIALNYFKESYWLFCLIGETIYLGQLIYYVRLFLKEYRQLIRKGDAALDDYSTSHFKWILRFFYCVASLGVSAAIAPYCPIQVFDGWLLFSALFYMCVVVSFFNYWGNTAHVVEKVVKAEVKTIVNIPHDDEELQGYEKDYAMLEENLQRWKDRRGYVENDLISEELAQQLGTNIVVLRSYFRERQHTDFRQWRLRLRIDYACQIMHDHPECSYEAVADMVGICDRSNFQKAFRKIKGMSPREYKESLE